VFWANPELTLAYSFLAHSPSDAFDPSFGSLINYSEIWSLSWAPGRADGLATASEDQTVKIWDLTTQTAIMTLPKHAKAVTGVVWYVNDQSAKEQLVSCSDDMNVRLYDATTWELLRSFTTYFIREWHTITYVGVQGPYIACSTQIGFIVIFNIDTGATVLSRRVHTGSIEGLVWRSHLATVASDCTVAKYSINE
jgi:WD40 repeat protein